MPSTPQSYKPGRGRAEWKGTKQERGYGNGWEQISLSVRARHPVCQICRSAKSVDVDHIIPFNGVNDPLRTDRANLQALCRQCHVRKTRNQ